ncbi:MAG: SDR family oxidoreductase, partial [Limnobacter sp.]|nr:SDR family oxidoreductase [Limnobacter sp.]
KGKTKSGFETTFGVCHMGHFLLTDLLLPALKQSDEARIINVASMMHRLAKTIDLDKQTKPTQSATGLKEYGVAKLANILFTRSLAKKLEGTSITSYSLHPGAVATDVYRQLPRFLQPVIKLFMLTPEEGASTTLYLASAPVSVLQNGAYYVNSREQAPSTAGRDNELAERLWQRSEEWLAG